MEYRSVFELHNFGNATIHFKLVPNYVEQSAVVVVRPVAGSIQPRWGHSIQVEYIVTEPGKQSVDIFSAIRKCDNSCDTIKNSERLVFTLKCNAIYPCLQILDIACQNYGPLFTKKELWNMLHIDELNKTLCTLKHGQDITLKAWLPECEQSEEKYEVILVVRNTTHLPAPLNLKRRQVCNCKMTQQKGQMTRRSLAYSCRHRDMFEMRIDDPNVPPLSISNLLITIYYSLEGLTVMSYKLHLKHNRSITWDFCINTLQDNSACISKYSQKFRLEMLPVCLCEQNPILQCFWLYNNTGKGAQYKLETSQLEEYNKNYGFPVIQCWKPKGSIDSYSAASLMFQFHPLEVKQFELKLPLTLGEESTIFTLVGTASKTFRSYPIALIKSPPMLNILSRIVLSTDFIAINPFPVWSETKRIFFIKNMSKEKVIGYSWQKFEIAGIIQADVSYRTGVLRPKEIHSVVMRFKSFGEPCRTQMNIVCKLLDHTQYYMHKKTVDARNIMQKKLNEEFTITEEGEFYRQNTVEVVPFPEVFHRTISIEVMITGVQDRSLQYNTNEQMQHWPQSTMLFPKRNYAPVFKRNDPLEEPIGMNKKEGEDEMSSVKVVKMNQGDAYSNQFCKKFFELILGDVIFSEFYHDILLKKKDVPAIYYTQIKQNDSTLTDSVNELYNDPQPSIITHILHEALTEGVHQVFNYPSPQVHHGNIDYMKDIEKNAQKLICNHNYNCECRINEFVM